jgi:hypothetical protein
MKLADAVAILGVAVASANSFILIIPIGRGNGDAVVNATVSPSCAAEARPALSRDQCSWSSIKNSA